MGCVYLIHFDQPYKHAKHYLGYVNGKKENVEKRLDQHKNGTGARLMEVVVNAGITFSVSRIFENVDRSFERRLKQRGKGRICPACILIVENHSKMRIGIELMSMYQP